MKRRILLIVCFVFAVEQLCHALWESIPLKDLIRESDVIVVGKLKRVKIIKRYKNRGFLYEGSIYVDEHLAGNEPAKRKYILRWTYHTRFCPTVSHQRLANKKGIWLLQKERDTKKRNYKANYPGRFVELDKLGTVRSLIKAPLYSVQANQAKRRPVYSTEQPTKVTFSIETFEDTLIVTDYIREIDGTLELRGNIKINVRNRHEEVPPNSNVRKIADTRETIVVTKEKPYIVQLDLGKYFDFKRSLAHTIWWGNDDEHSSRRESFQVRVEDEFYQAFTAHQKNGTLFDLQTSRDFCDKGWGTRYRDAVADHFKGTPVDGLTLGISKSKGYKPYAGNKIAIDYQLRNCSKKDITITTTGRYKTVTTHGIFKTFVHETGFMVITPTGELIKGLGRPKLEDQHLQQKRIRQTLKPRSKVIFNTRTDSDAVITWAPSERPRTVRYVIIGTYDMSTKENPDRRVLSQPLVISVPMICRW